MAAFIRSDLEFILQQILVAEENAAGTPLVDILPNIQVPFGLRTVSGVDNNLVFNENLGIDQSQFGAADTVFPHLLPPVFNVAEGLPANFFGPGSPAVPTTNYAQTSGMVVDSQPRIISNLIVDQTSNNPAIAAALGTPGAGTVTSPGLDGVFGTPDDTQVAFIPNVTPDAGLGAPFNAWFTFFGQFFDHGLDLVTKGGQDIIFIPLQPDDPLYKPGSPTNFMVETRATNVSVTPGADGIFGINPATGVSDDSHNNENTTTPFIDQNQTYTSHPSHQVFLRAYQLLNVDPDGAGPLAATISPFATGKLITNRSLGADGHFGTGDDVEIGGMSTWAVVKAQARDVLGINLTDADFDNVPLLATDAYGNFIPGAHGFPQVVMKGSDGIAGTADDFMVEGNPSAPVDLTNAVRTGHQFLIDVAHNAVPVFDATGHLAPDADNIAGNSQPTDAQGNNVTYDDELLNAHYIAGDGRANENIGLTAVHSIFHSEHNRLVDQTKLTLITDAIAKNDETFLNQWLLSPISHAALSTLDPAHLDSPNLVWNGERLFQAGRFGTEMQYQHLVFEEFARTVQPGVDEFLAPLGYDATINPAIVSEFANTVYRFGHSMLTETVDRFTPDFNLVADPNSPTHQLGLIAAFLNPLEFVASGPTPTQAVGDIVRGLTRTVGNEIDEFVTEALRNNLLGTPLDLAVLNLARGRDTGVPSLNEARRDFYSMTTNNDVADSNVKPYTSWVDFMGHIKHPESLINFIAAYGTHSALLAADVDTLVEMRAVAAALVLGGSATINAGTAQERIFIADNADRLAFLNSTGAYANTAAGVTTTGVDDIDFWVGGLAEEQTPFGGLLGSSFNFVFENQLEALQNGDRFYYLARTAGLHFGAELENNTFSQLVMLNSDATHLPANIFSTPTWTLEVDSSTRQFTGLGANGRADPTRADDPTGGITINGHEVASVVVRDNPGTPGADTNYLQYIGENHIVLGGTDPGNAHNPSGNDILIAGEGDDTVWGDGGNDRMEGGAGNDQYIGGDGDDIITDIGGNDVIHGGSGNDVIIDGHSIFGTELGNIILGGDGKDFIATWDDISTIFGGTGDDFIYGSKPNLPETGNEGDDWIELGTQDGAPGDNFSPLLADDVPGNDIFVGGGGFDEMIGEGGDDIFVGSDAQDKMDGMSGFDWVTYKNDTIGVTVDLDLAALNEPPVAASPASILDRFAEVEGLSGSKYADYLRGSEADAAEIATFSAKTSALDAAGIARVAGLQAVLDHALGGPVTGFGTGNIILGGDGSDIILGRGGDDVIDGDASLNVRVSVRANADGTGPEIASFDSLAPLIPLMESGLYNPGQLVAVREIIPGTHISSGTGFDTAVFTGVRADYSITIAENGTPLNFADDVVTVVDVADPTRDGTDHLTHIERLQFADTAFELTTGVDAVPVGSPTIADGNGGAVEVGDLLTVSIAGVTDADNVTAANPTGAITGPIRYTWQSEAVAGSGVFEDIILLPGGDLAFESASGTSFRITPDLAGLALRVKAIYTDAKGVTEQAFSARTTPVVAAVVAPPVTPPADGRATTEGGAGVHLVRSDLDFILKQIKIAEAHALHADSTGAIVPGTPLQDLIPNIRLAYGLRSVDGSENNLLDQAGTDQSDFGAADTTFPRLLDPVFRTAENGTTYNQTSGTVIDSQPRVISNLIVDQTASNPAAYATAYDPGVNGHLDFGVSGPTNDDVLKDGVEIVKSPGLDGKFGTADDRDVFNFPNVTPDAGLGAPFNAWFTFFGQFFDHGLDLVTKGGNGTIFVPLKADDPLVAGADGIFGNADDLPPQLRFMVETRATMLPGADGVLGTADDIHQNENTTTPFVDQNQTYTSHPSHQVFLRAYQVVDVDNGPGVKMAPVSTGKLITNRDLGADGKYGTADDHEIGGMATWKVVKAQARDILGINLTDKDFDNVPLLATDQYGNFIAGAHGLPQVVIRTGNGGDGIAGTADDITTLVEGNPSAPIDLTNAVRTGHQFLIDVAHNAVPVLDVNGNLVADADSVAGNSIPADALGNNLAYDNELLDAHYIAGDGRVNENIGLTTVHSIFHSEHNRLVDQTKETILGSNDVAFLNEWLLTPVTVFPPDQTAKDALVWDGERLFQVAKFGTEMQYQHLVFEEFARTVQPMIDPFFAPTQVYDVNLNPAIVAEFAHTVYRFGHSMLTETVDRFDAHFNVVGDPNSADPDQQLGLIAAFLNPLAFAASGPTPVDATSAIVRGLTRTVGNEIDEFVTEALRNNLLGTPLDLPVLNITRGRDTGIPTLQAARRDFFKQTGDTWVKPYTSWADMVQHMKHPESLVNFVAAYGTHAAITSATTFADARAAALLLVLGDGNDADGVTIRGVTYTDRLDFLNSTGIWADSNNTHAVDLDGVSRTGLGNIDFWIGGLAEAQLPFGGLLGSTFNFVFENQLEKLQDADRFYYLERTSGLSFGNELESNSFAKLIMANTTAVHLPALVFTTPAFTLEVDPTKQFTGLGASERDDPTGGIAIQGHEITPLVIRDDPNTVNTVGSPDTHYLHYTGEDHVVLGGTEGNDTILSGDGDDTLWGDGGNDRLDGGYGDDNIRGGAGDDIITDTGGSDNIQGGDGNDVIQGGAGTDLILGGFGNDFIVTGEDNDEAFGGAGDDFILGNKSNEQDIGNEGDDWIEKGTSDGAPGDNFDPLGNDPIIGNDIFLGDGENDKFIGEGGDDIMVGSTGLTDRMFGASGFDWATYKEDRIGVTVDFSGRFFDQPPVPGSGASALARFDIMEGLSGSSHDDFLAGDDAVDLVGGEVGAGVNGSALTNIALIDGLQTFLDTAALGTHVTSFTTGNIILGGAGSDIMMGRAGNDIIDGDAWLNVRISVRQLNDHNVEMTSYDSMQQLAPFMFNGTYKVSQLQAVREILYAHNPPPTPTTPVDTHVPTGDDRPDDFETAKFSGLMANYDVFDMGGGVTQVIDRVGTDGTDTVMNVERLQFSDQSIVLGGLDHLPVGLLTVSDTTPTEDQTLTVSIAGVHDADNIVAVTNPTGAINPPVAYFWQAELKPGTGIFEDITRVAAGEITRMEGTSFTPSDAEVGLLLRVRAVYQDKLGVLEEVFSAPTAAVANVNDAPTGTPTISDTTPTQDRSLTASTALIADPDGFTTAAFAFQWQQAATATGPFTNITGATTQTFTPSSAQTLGVLRVRVTFTDDGGTTETLFSAPTGPVGIHLIGTAAAQTLGGTAFDDWLEGLGGADVLNGLGGSDLLDGGAGADTLNGGDGDDVLIGGAGADTLNGNLGADDMQGGADNDTYFVDNSGDTVTELAAGGTDNVQSTLNAYALSANVENLTFTGTGNFAGTGNELANVITGGIGNDILIGGGGNDTLNGGAGNDTLDGGAGNDTMAGGIGDDTYTVDAAADVVNEAANQGTDTVKTTLNALTLANQAENLTFIGTGNFAGTGNNLGNLITGGAGSDSLNGGTGIDTLVGLGGNDTYTVDNTLDVVVEGAGAGTDTINSSVSYTLSANVENLTLTGAGNINATGNALANVLIGNTGNNILDGLGGADNMAGGLGNDTYIVDAGDVVTELAGGGTDTINTALVTFSLATLANVENLTFTGTVAFTGTGNALANAITGNAGNDTLDGGAGNDTMAGGAGNDTYFVDAVGDAVNETAGQGTDTVNTTLITYSLTANVEKLAFIGPSGGTFAGNGNGLDNTITGGATTANTLTGGAGNDVLNGGGVTDNLSGEGGDDTVLGLAGNDTLTGGAGNDVLDGGADNDSISGDGGDDTLLGGAGADNLAGGAGNDIVDGGAGNDTMTGDGGNDFFRVAAGFGSDTINGFGTSGAAQDQIDVSSFHLTSAAIGTSITITGGANALITVLGGGATGGTITLSGVNANTINATDFKFS